jgi:hydrogenase maturation protein HypF
VGRARCAIDVEGLAQGVGFRPYVHGLARRLGLGGFICNQAGGVHIEIEGEAAALEQFMSALHACPPPAAAIARLVHRAESPRDEREFQILPSETASPGPVVAGADLAICPDCVKELFDR